MPPRVAARWSARLEKAPLLPMGLPFSRHERTAELSPMRRRLLPLVLKETERTLSPSMRPTFMAASDSGFGVGVVPVPRLPRKLSWAGSRVMPSTDPARREAADWRTVLAMAAAASWAPWGDHVLLVMV